MGTEAGSPAWRFSRNEAQSRSPGRSSAGSRRAPRTLEKAASRARRAALGSGSNPSSASVQTATIKVIANMDIIKSNNWRDLAETDESALGPVDGVGQNVPVEYQVDMSDLICLGGTASATGVVELLAIQTETEKSVFRQGELLLSKMLTGHGVLRPECAFAISKGV